MLGFLVVLFFFNFFPIFSSLALEQMSLSNVVPWALQGSVVRVNSNFHSSIPGSESLGDVG